MPRIVIFGKSADDVKAVLAKLSDRERSGHMETDKAVGKKLQIVPDSAGLPIEGGGGKTIRSLRFNKIPVCVPK